MGCKVSKAKQPEHNISIVISNSIASIGGVQKEVNLVIDTAMGRTRTELTPADASAEPTNTIQKDKKTISIVMRDKGDIGLIGLGVMGENLAINIESHGFCVAVWNRTPDKVTSFMEKNSQGKRFVGCTTLQEFIHSLKVPRKILFMVMAGKPVDG